MILYVKIFKMHKVVQEEIENLNRLLIIKNRNGKDFLFYNPRSYKGANKTQCLIFISTSSKTQEMSERNGSFHEGCVILIAKLDNNKMEEYHKSVPS